ncbi:MAG: hypothetical protein NC299_17515 [Lachnospiraceae bacterium]|nr:hypothetical protein [Ruminococcus sp.]MCM1277131.1 hypothetical protein [Lachnospiraceae bacterium]
MRYEDKKVEFVKLGENANRVKLSSVYDNNCSEGEYVIVNDDVLEVLQQPEREYERERSRRRRHGNKFIYLGNDENFDAKLGLTVNAPDEAVESKMYLEHIRQFFEDKVYERGMLYFLQNYSLKEIAEMDGVSEVAVFKSVSKFKKTMAKLYKIKLE